MDCFQSQNTAITIKDGALVTFFDDRENVIATGIGNMVEGKMLFVPDSPADPSKAKLVKFNGINYSVEFVEACAWPPLHYHITYE